MATLYDAFTIEWPEDGDQWAMEMPRTGVWEGTWQSRTLSPV